MPRSDGPLMVAIEGPDGVGKGSVIRAMFSDAIRRGWRNFHHEPPTGTMRLDPWWLAMHFATCRAEEMRWITDGVYGEPSVIVCDRWFWSTRVEALTRGVPDATQHAMLALVAAERAEYDGRVARGELRPMRTILLDAPTEVLEARTTQRDGRVHPNLAAIRAEYLSLAQNLGWPVVSTDCLIDEAAAKVARIIDGWTTEERET